MSSWHSYPSIYNIGHRALAPLMDHVLNVEEKIDGSQFSWGVIEGRLRAKSKNKEIDLQHPESLFASAVKMVQEKQALWHPEWTYRGEALQKPKHNTLGYDRVPPGHVILFDINREEEDYLSYQEKAIEAERVGLMCVPLLAIWHHPTIEEFRSLLPTVSCLGGAVIEGVVIKPVNYDCYGVEKKVLMGKYVSEQFKEQHRIVSKIPTGRDVIALLAATFATPARWQKAVIHLQEQGMLEGSVKDIGQIIREIPADVLKEHEEEIKDALLKWAWRDLSKGLTRGVAEWYKQRLLETQLPSQEDQSCVGE